MEEVNYIQGDLVKIKPSVFDEECDEVFQIVVSSREGTFVLRNVRNTNVMFAVQEEQINPIPLTSAILEANGWDKSSLCLSYFKEYNKENQKILVFVDFQEDSRWYVKFNTDKIYIKYIHQLQHLLFGLGLNSELKV